MKLGPSQSSNNSFRVFETRVSRFTRTFGNKRERERERERETEKRV
jgi:hypothetical protein